MGFSRCCRAATTTATCAACAAPTTQTLSVGETPQQVEASLGKPERIVKLGAKTIYWYPRLKVVFVNNKLTEAQ